MSHLIYFFSDLEWSSKPWMRVVSVWIPPLRPLNVMAVVPARVRSWSELSMQLTNNLTPRTTPIWRKIIYKRVTKSKPIDSVINRSRLSHLSSTRILIYACYNTNIYHSDFRLMNWIIVRNPRYKLSMNKQASLKFGLNTLDGDGQKRSILPFGSYFTRTFLFILLSLTWPNLDKLRSWSS